MNHTIIIKNIHIVFLIFSIIIISSYSVAPIYGIPTSWCTRVQTLNMPASPSSIQAFSLTTCAPISAFNYRMPYVAIAGASQLVVVGNQALRMKTKIIYTATSNYQIQILSQSGTAPNLSISWVPNSWIKFYIMFSQPSVSNCFVSSQVNPLSATGQFNDISAPQIFSGTGVTVTKVYTFTQVFGTSPISFSVPSSRIRQVICSVELTTLTILTGKYGIDVSTAMVTSTSFKVDITAKYALTLTDLIISIFITDSLFPAQGFQFQFDFFNTPIMGLGGTGIQYKAINGWSIYPGMNLVLGLIALNFDAQPRYGFQFTVDLSVYAPTLTAAVKNFFVSTNIIKSLTVNIFTIEQLVCPNGQLFIDTTANLCYPICPLWTSPSITYRSTGLTICQSCTILDNCCTAGFYFNSATSTCNPCSVLANCLQCSSSSVCTLCAVGYTVNLNTCSLTCGVGCASCTPTACLSCQSGLIPNGLSCKCPTGKYLNGGGNNCLACSITGCVDCSSSTVCVVCSIGYYVNAGGSCITCSPGCYDCNSTSCITCQNGLVLSGTTCACPSGFYYSTSSSNCVTCQNPLVGCIQCSSSTICTSCITGYYLTTSNICQTCSTGCIDCDSTGCLKCQNNYVLTYDSTLSPSNVCKQCSTLYGSFCLTCNITQCLACMVGYFYRVSLKQCLALSSVICGDGSWIQQVQACDDQNLIDGDGCNSQCQVQTDYVCLLVDKLASGASFCKYTKDLFVQFYSLEKDISSNSVTILLNLEPSTFNQWTQAQVKNLLNPIQIIDQTTGTATLVQLNSMNIFFVKNSQTNQVQLVIDYGNSILQGSYIRFNIDPTQTSYSALQTLPIQNNKLIKINSNENGNYLYNYSQQVYDDQKMIQSLCTAIGFISFFMIFQGLFSPSGKIIILQTLVVIQITYFSILQLQKIPPTYIGMKNLGFSNGFNDKNIEFRNNRLDQNIYKLMNLKIQAISNINISLILFVFCPSIIGLIGIIVSKYLLRQTNNIDNKQIQSKQKQNLNSQKDVKDQTLLKDGSSEQNQHSIMQNKNQFKKSQIDKKSNPEQTLVKQTLDKQHINQNKQINKQQQQKNIKRLQTLSLVKLFSERLLYQNTLYGIFVTAYLSWISIFHSFNKVGISNFILMVIIWGFQLGFGYLFVKSSQKGTYINEIFNKPYMHQVEGKDGKKQKQESQLLSRNFGQFSEVYNQIIPDPGDPSPKILQKIYMFYIIQRLLNSLIIVMIPSQSKITSVLIMLVYGSYLGGMIMLNKKYKIIQKQQKQQQIIKKQQQPVNIQQQQKAKQLKQVMQILYPQKMKKQQQKQIQQQKPSKLKYFYQNYIFRQGFNFITVLLIQIIYLYTNISLHSQDSYNTFVNNQIIIKIVPLAIIGLLAINILINQFLWIIQFKYDNIVGKAKSLFQNLFPQVVQKLKKKRDITIDIDNQSKRQEEQVVKMLTKFMETSAIYQHKQSPFIGIQEKQKQATKDALLGLFKVQQKRAINIPTQAKKLRNKLIDQFWDQI